jgi:hypothetical protein
MINRVIIPVAGDERGLPLKVIKDNTPNLTPEVIVPDDVNVQVVPPSVQVKVE